MFICNCGINIKLNANFIRNTHLRGWKVGREANKIPRTVKRATLANFQCKVLLYALNSKKSFQSGVFSLDHVTNVAKRKPLVSSAYPDPGKT